MVEGEVLTLARQYADKVRNIMNVENIFLFGSQARGTATEESDIDIAIVVDALPDNYLDAAAGLWKLAYTVDFRIEPILLSPESLESGFLQTVRNTGIAV